jgi:tetratricopeptide (TPR) repeat protein
MKKIITFSNLALLMICLLIPGRSAGADYWFEHGLSFSKSKRYEEAIKAFSKSIKINPGNSEAYNNRGAAWYSKGDYDRAIADYTKALDINPRYVDAYNNRGGAWYQKGDYDRAIADCTKALDIDPRAADVYNNRGGAWSRKGDYDRAIADYTKALEINPRYADAYNQIAWILAICPDETCRNGAKAVKMAQKAVEFNPGANTLDTLAAAYAEAGKFGDAIKTQKRVISLLNKEGRTEELAEQTERLRTYIAHKPWRGKDTRPEEIKKQLPRIETIKVSIANIRANPTTRSSIIDKLRTGEKVKLIHLEDEWYFLKLPDGRFGWAHQRLFLK